MLAYNIFQLHSTFFNQVNFSILINCPITNSWFQSIVSNFFPFATKGLSLHAKAQPLVSSFWALVCKTWLFCTLLMPINGTEVRMKYNNSYVIVLLIVWITPQSYLCVIKFNMNSFCNTYQCWDKFHSWGKRTTRL